MRDVADLAALHGAYWSMDRRYRTAWQVWPVTLALLVTGWICIGKPNAASPPAPPSWAKPATPPARNGSQPPVYPPIGQAAQTELDTCLSSRNDIAACTKVIDKKQVAGPRLAAAYTQRGYIQRESDPDAALRDYGEALQLKPDAPDALDGRAWIAMNRGHYEAALPDLDRAVAAAPEMATPHYYRGFALLKLEQYGKALAELNEAVKLQPNNAEIYLARGLVEEAQDFNDAALLDFDEVSRHAPKSPRGLIQRALVLETMGRPQDALTALDAALKIAPSDPEALSQRDRLRAQPDGKSKDEARNEPKGDRPAK
jgi:tetratricopeptide (TPR) repeat protein